jgi:hypothetical protein
VLEVLVTEGSVDLLVLALGCLACSHNVCHE